MALEDVQRMLERRHIDRDLHHEWVQPLAGQQLEAALFEVVTEVPATIAKVRDLVDELRTEFDDLRRDLGEEVPER